MTYFIRKYVLIKNTKQRTSASKYNEIAVSKCTSHLKQVNNGVPMNGAMLCRR
jgi:hypothetical protein